MNYDETAKKILSDWDNYCFKLLDGDTPAFDIQEAIAAALRRAVNEAAWRGWKAGVTAQDHAWHGRVEQCHYCEEMHAETYGPPPEGCKR